MIGSDGNFVRSENLSNILCSIIFDNCKVIHSDKEKDKEIKIGSDYLLFEFVMYLVSLGLWVVSHPFRGIADARRRLLNVLF